MSKAFYQNNQTSINLPAREHFPHPQIEDEEKKVQTEIEEEKWSIQQGAKLEARKRQSPLIVGSAEAQMKRLSEEVTRQAQEKLEQIKHLLR